MHTATISQPNDGTETAPWGWPFLRALIGAARTLGPIGTRLLMPIIVWLARRLLLIDAVTYVSAADGVRRPHHAPAPRGAHFNLRRVLRLSDRYWRKGGLDALARIADAPTRTARRLARLIRRAFTGDAAAIFDLARAAWADFPAIPSSTSAPDARAPP